MGGSEGGRLLPDTETPHDRETKRAKHSDVDQSSGSAVPQPETVLDWCQANFSNFKSTINVCKTWVDGEYPAIFLGTCDRRGWDGRTETYAVLGEFHSDRPVMVLVDRCDFQVMHVRQVSATRFKVSWETGEVTEEPQSAIRHILQSPQCPVEYLPSHPNYKRSAPVSMTESPTSVAPSLASQSTSLHVPPAELLSESLVEPSKDSLLRQLLRLYPTDFSNALMLEHRRLVGEHGVAAMLKSPPARRLSAQHTLFMERLFRSVRGFSPFVDSFVLGVCFNCHPAAVWPTLTPSRLPPHPLTVIQPDLFTHRNLLIELVKAIPAQWAHFVMSSPDAYTLFDLPDSLSQSIAQLLASLTKQIDAIAIDESDYGTAEPEEGAPADPSPQPMKQFRRRPNLSGSDIAAVKAAGYTIDDIMCGYGPGPIPATNTLDSTKLRNVQILDSVITFESLPPAPAPPVRCHCPPTPRTCATGTCDCASLDPVKGTSRTDSHRHKPFYVDGKVAVPPSVWIVECNAECGCPATCGNRVVQRRRWPEMEVIFCGPKGWGARALQPIAKGEFVHEYVGELIPSEEAERRGRKYDAIGCSTLYDLDFADNQNKYTLDASYFCSVARFFNHSCRPNLINYQVLIEHRDVHRPRICFFAARAIAVGDELTFDYRYPTIKKMIPCFCGESNCRKWLM